MLPRNDWKKAPNYFKLWMSSEDDNEVMAINEKLEALVEEMSNTKSATLIGALNNYPVISVFCSCAPVPYILVESGSWSYFSLSVYFSISASGRSAFVWLRIWNGL